MSVCFPMQMTKRLFGTDDVVGMTVDVNCYGLTKSLRICGVTTQKENGTFVSYTYEGMPVTINVPYTTMNEFTGVSDYFFSVTMQTDKSLNSQDVADKVVKLMEKRHQCAGKDYFQVQSFQDIMSSMNQMLDMVTAFISFVRRNFTAGWRNRRYEYHAGFCHRTYQGNWYP